MIDIHTHIIPGVDDGAKDIETSIKMILKEIEYGVDTVVFTPHSYMNGFINKHEIIESFNLFKTKLENFNVFFSK